jgi:hypothetical protein
MVFTHTYYLPRKLAPSFTLLLYPTVLLDGARPANTCISTLHPLDGARALPGVPREPRLSRWVRRMVCRHPSREFVWDTSVGRSSSI